VGIRHTFASWLAIAGVSLRRIQELLGHKSITTTERYSHLGQNGSHPYYFELASCVVNRFVPRFTELLNCGIGLPALMKLMGHKSILMTMTLRYLKVAQPDSLIFFGEVTIGR
jgi:site-specific recombinase XerD